MAGLFDDGKEPDALRTIGEVSRALGIRQHVLRYWEDQFPTLKPIKRSGGRRYYRPEDIALIARIDQLVHREGYTLRGARQAIAGDSGGGEALPEGNVAAVSTRSGGAGPGMSDQPSLAHVGDREGKATLVAGLLAIQRQLAEALEKAA